MNMRIKGPEDLPSPVDFIEQLVSQLSRCQPVAAPPTSTKHGSVDRTSQRANQGQNPLSALSTSESSRVKPIMLTLHCLFPNELLLALDILDRKLVQRLSVQEAHSKATTAMPDGDTQLQGGESSSQPSREGHASEDAFFVISASSTSHSSHSGKSHPSSTYTITPPTTTHQERNEKGYEVRLRAWNCTCPTFALSSFRNNMGLLADDENPTSTDQAPNPDAALIHQQPETSRPEYEHHDHQYKFGGSLTCASTRASYSPPIITCKHLLACLLAVRCPALFGRDSVRERTVSVEELAAWCAGWVG